LGYFLTNWVRGWGWAIDDLRLQIQSRLQQKNLVFKELFAGKPHDYVNLAYTFQRQQEVHVSAGGLLNERIENC
jgi:hypothetical protein